MCELSPVTFHGDTIFCIEHQNQPYAPMRPIVENMGLDWKSQSAKLNANKGRWATVAIITTVAQDGREREMLCLPVRKLPAFLASINPRKVRPELRERIELYQAECDDALWNYWMHGKAERPARNIADDIVPAPRGAAVAKSLFAALNRASGTAALDLSCLAGESAPEAARGAAPERPGVFLSEDDAAAVDELFEDSFALSCDMANGLQDYLRDRATPGDDAERILRALRDLGFSLGCLIQAVDKMRAAAFRVKPSEPS